MVLLHNYLFLKNPVLYYNNYCILLKENALVKYNKQSGREATTTSPHMYYHPFLPLTQTDLFNDSQTCYRVALVVWKHVHMHMCVWLHVCACFCFCVCVRVCQLHGIAQPRKEWQHSELGDRLRVNKSC